MDDYLNLELCAAIKKISYGDLSALDTIYCLMGNAMLPVAIMVCCNRSDAEDAVHDALLVIVKKANKFTYCRNAYSWVNTLTKNLAKNRLLKRKNLKEEPLQKLYDKCTYIDEESLEIREMLSILNDKENNLIYLKYWFGLSLEKIAIELRKPKTTIAYQIQKIEKKLKNSYKI